MDKAEIKLILEALLMVSDRPLSLDEMSKIVRKGNQRASRKGLLDALEELKEECEGRSYELKEVASGYRYQTRSQFAHWLAKLWEQKPPRYSRAALETLALIAYKQPITRAAIEEVRGVAVNTSIIRSFEERGWIKVVGHKETPGHPALYATTKNFLDDFNLCSTGDLPELPDISNQEDILPLQLANNESAEVLPKSE